jgi:hypothetical protein
MRGSASTIYVTRPGQAMIGDRIAVMSAGKLSNSDRRRTCTTVSEPVRGRLHRQSPMNLIRGRAGGRPRQATSRSGAPESDGVVAVGIAPES